MGAFVDPSTFAPVMRSFSSDIFHSSAFLGYARQSSEWDRLRGPSFGSGSSGSYSSVREEEDYFAGEDEDDLEAERVARAPLVAPRGLGGKLITTDSYSAQQSSTTEFEFE